MRTPSIRDAWKLCKDIGARGVIVLAFDDGGFAGASYGDTKAECSVYGRVLDAIADEVQSGRIQVPLGAALPPRWECAACGRAEEKR